MALLTENLINHAMQQLAREHSDFGVSGRDQPIPNFKERFRNAVYDKLSGCSDLPPETVFSLTENFTTDQLIGDNIRADILAQTERDFSVLQLQYITMNVGRHDKKPNDPPAFSYDIFLECLKAELIMLSSLKSTFGFVVALTDWPPFWGEGSRPKGWSRNFGDRLTEYPVCLQGITTTTGANPINCIYAQERCHISLWRTWNGRWHGFGKNFRYLLLQCDTPHEPLFGHPMSDDTIPFLSEAAKASFMSRRSEARRE